MTQSTFCVLKSVKILNWLLGSYLHRHLLAELFLFWISVCGFVCAVDRARLKNGDVTYICNLNLATCELRSDGCLLMLPGCCQSHQTTPRQSWWGRLVCHLFSFHRVIVCHKYLEKYLNTNLLFTWHTWLKCLANCFSAKMLGLQSQYHYL